MVLHLHSKISLLRLRNWQLLVCLALLVLGILFRFGNLQQVYWHDEAYTSLRLSGYTSVEVKHNLFTDRLVSIADLLYYQSPNLERSVVGTINSLALDNAQHPPLYSILARWWVEVFGKPIWILRSFSALVSILAFPTIYWLCQELFDLNPPSSTAAPQPPQKLTGSIAMVLVAISPFHILYAQEARGYALWTVLILGLSGMFLRSLRLNNFSNWSGYTLLIIASLYIHPFSGFVVFGHGVYALILDRCRLSKRILTYALSAGVGFLAFIPWLLVLMKEGALSRVSWTGDPIPFDIFLKLWGLHITRCFILTEGDFGFDTWQVYTILPFLLLLLSYSFYFLWRYATREFRWFVLIFMAASSLPLVLPDLILGGQRSSAGRYLIPTILGMQMALAFLFASQLSQRYKIQSRYYQNLWQQRFFPGVIAIIIFLNLGAGINILQADTAWTKVINYYLPSLAAVVNHSQKPLVISSSTGINLGTILTLSHALDRQVRFLLLDNSRPIDISDILYKATGFETVFLLNPSADLQKNFSERNIALSLSHNDTHLHLWQLTNLH